MFTFIFYHIWNTKLVHILTEEEEIGVMRQKRVYQKAQLKDHKSSNLNSKKALQLTGDVLLLSDKALRLIGESPREEVVATTKTDENDIRKNLLLTFRANMRKLMGINGINSATPSKYVIHSQNGIQCGLDSCN